MKKVWDLAHNTYRETIRDRVLNVAVVFAIALVVASVLLGSLSIGQDNKIVKDFGLAAIELFGAAIAIFVGTGTIAKETERRTIFILLSKPVTRSVFLAGKFLGLGATVSTLLVSMAIPYFLLLAYLHAFSPQLGWQIALVWLQLLLVTAMALMFSTFASPVMAMVFTGSLYFVGHNLDAFGLLAQRSGTLVRPVLRALYYSLPNLGHLDIKNQVVYGAAFSPQQWLTAAAYGATYSCLALALATWFFKDREF